MRLRRLLPLFVVALAACTGNERSSALQPAAPVAQVAGPRSPAAAVAPPAKMVDPDPSTSAVQSSSPSSPAYDIAVDRQRRARLAKEELGPKAISTVVSDVFVVIGPPGWQGGQFEQSVALMRSAMAGYLNGRFGKKPREAISVYLFPNASTYEAFCTKKYSAPCIAHFGFYQPGDRYMVMNIGLGLGTLTHEIVHPLVESRLPGGADVDQRRHRVGVRAAADPEAGRDPRRQELASSASEAALTTRRATTTRALDRLFGMPDDDLPRRRRGSPLRDGALRLPVARRARQALAVLSALARQRRRPTRPARSPSRRSSA